jgi:predicted nucleic acid-binding protein
MLSRDSKRCASVAGPRRSAARLAGILGLPVYDCLYLAVALREGAYVVTADARFVAAVNLHPEFGGKVRLLGG